MVARQVVRVARGLVQHGIADLQQLPGAVVRVANAQRRRLELDRLAMGIAGQADVRVGPLPGELPGWSRSNWLVFQPTRNHPKQASDTLGDPVTPPDPPRRPV
jgi:hypothetical protein